MHPSRAFLTQARVGVFMITEPNGYTGKDMVYVQKACGLHREGACPRGRLLASGHHAVL